MNSDDQSSKEQVFTPNKDGILFDPLNKFIKRRIIKIEKFIDYFLN